MKSLLIAILFFTIPAAAYMGGGVKMEAYVEGCQTYPLTGVRLVILGQMEAVESDRDGFYTFEDNLPPGEYTIYAYTNYSDYYREGFKIAEGMEDVFWHIMLCTCVENTLSVISGRVLDEKGSPVADATVSIDDLLLSTKSSKSGYYDLVVPPGEWTVTAYDNNFGSAEYKFTTVAPEDPGIEPEPIKYDFKLKK